MTREQLDAIRARVDDGFPPASSLDIVLLLAEVERLRRELDKATDDHIESQRNGAREAIARKAAEAEVERLTSEVESKVTQNVALIGQNGRPQQEVERLTDEELDALEALAAAAAPGHWFGATPEENAPSLQYTHSARKAVPVLIAALREARAELDFIKAEYADASTEDLTRDALLLRLRVQESANEGLRASVATLTADPLPAAAWVREVERAAFQRGVTAMREAAAHLVEHKPRHSPPAQGTGFAQFGCGYCDMAAQVRALPDPEDK